MRLRRLLTVSLAAGGLFAAVLSAPAGSAHSAPSAPPIAGAHTGGKVFGSDAKTGTVTLITGDQVSVGAGGAVVVRRAAGRSGMTFLTSRANGRLTVIPSDAVPLLAKGKLDRRLFDVTSLLADGFDGRGELPLIVQYDRKAKKDTRAKIDAAGIKVGRDLSSINGYAVAESRKRAGGLWRTLTGGAARPNSLSGGVAKVWLDGRRQPSLDVSVPQIGAPSAWAAGHDGTGVTVAVLDTGIDAAHPDLLGRVAGKSNFTDEDDLDREGHGTHVASIIAGSGAASEGRRRGVAPGATLLDGKVCVEIGCPESWIIAGMQWAVDQGAQVVNISLGGPDTPDIDPLEQAVNELSATRGVLFVVSAGNSGPGDHSVSSPGSADAALTVGAVDSSDQVVEFSSRGPRIGDGAIKPDITAPGERITAANSKDGSMGEPGQPYVAVSGTSMAAPHVAGSAAILKQKNPQWTGDQLKAVLMASAKSDSTTSVFTQGAGRVDVARAVTQTITTEPASVSFGLIPWPHDDDEPITKVVTYRNSGTTDVTLALSIDAYGPTGQPAPTGMFVTDTTEVTVPAGGTANVSVTASPKVSTVDGLFGGWLTAVAGDVRVRTPIGVEREIEQYDVTVRFTDRAGAPTDSGFGILTSLDTFVSEWILFVPEATLRVPAGRYGFTSALQLTDGQVLLAMPEATVDKDLTINADARLGRPVSANLPDQKAVPVFATADATVEDPTLGGASVSVNTWDVDSNPIRIGRIGPDVTNSKFTLTVAGAWAHTGPTGVLHNSPVVYNLAWQVPGRMENGFTRTTTTDQLATVRADYARHGEGVIGETSHVPVAPRGLNATEVPLDLPGRRTLYFNNEPGIAWENQFTESVPNGTPWPDPVSHASDAPKTYQPGREYQDSWNRAVFGPSLIDHDGGTRPTVTRHDNELDVLIKLGDGAGRSMDSALTAASLKLYRNGTLVGESDYPGSWFTVPAEESEYRLEIEVDRKAPHTLSSRVTSVWTFTSGYSTNRVVLPLSVVRFSPVLDNTNTARCGRAVAVPVAVEAQPGSAAGGVARLTVDVSYDDGVNWRRVPVRGSDKGRNVIVDHPCGGGFVSLRAHATDTQGNEVRQTVIRAYRIR